MDESTPHHADGGGEYDMFARKARGLPSERHKLLADKTDPANTYLTDRQFKLANASGSLAIYQLGIVRGVATINPQESVAISTCMIGFASSEAAVNLYDDVLEGRVDRLKDVLEMIRKLKGRVELEVRNADKRRAQAEREGLSGEGAGS